MASTIRTSLFAFVALAAIVLVFLGVYIASEDPELAVAQAQAKKQAPLPPPRPVYVEEEEAPPPDLAPIAEALAATMAEEPAPPPSEGPQYGRVEVVVVDERGNPVEGADVRILHQRRDVDHRGIASVNERSPGVFEFEVRAGQVRVAVRATGYRLKDAFYVTVPANEVVHERVVLEPSATLSGRVIDRETRAPIEGARVTLFGFAANAPAITDSDGRFSFSMLPEEHISLDVRADGYATLQLGGIDGSRSRSQHVDLEMSPRGESPRVDVIGVGMWVKSGPDGAIVRKVYASSPAEEALAPGDVILEVDGVSLAGMNHRAAIGRIRGPEGSSVQLKVRKGDGSVHDVTLEREMFGVDPHAR